MAEVVPFKGIRYNPELIKDMAAVVAPPYDVISPREQEGFYERHPNNVIRLILGKSRAGDNATDNVHVRAAGYFNSWLDENILRQDATAAFYLTTVEYPLDGQWQTRFGIIGRVRLEPFEKGVILPHERTFSKVKSERLQLMKACHANFSPIFSLYAGGKKLLGRLQVLTEAQPPAMDVVDHKGHRHKMWRIAQDEMVADVTRFFENRRLYIADGHHRYETALNYRDWVKENTPQFTPEHAANFIMMTLCSMQDQGLAILPAHRLLKSIPEAVASSFLQKAETYFDATRFSAAFGHEKALADFEAALKANEHRPAIGFYAKSPAVLQVMLLKEGVMDQMFVDELPSALRDLDVSVLTHLIMMNLMGFDQNRLDDETQIAYRTSAADAVQAVNDGEADVAFILNPTRIEQVQRVAENGLIMPRKSTYFYPKAITGQVFNQLR